MVESRSPRPDLDTKADAPTSKARCLTSGSFIAENTMTFVSGFTRVTDDMPPVRGRWEVEVDHNYVRLESLRCFEHGAAVCDASHDLAVQCQQPADGFCDFRVVFR